MIFSTKRKLPGVVVGMSGTSLLHSASAHMHSTTVMFPPSHLYSSHPSCLEPLISHPLLHVIEPASGEVSKISFCYILEIPKLEKMPNTIRNIFYSYIYINNNLCNLYVPRNKRRHNLVLLGRAFDKPLYLHTRQHRNCHVLFQRVHNNSSIQAGWGLQEI